MSTEGLNGSGSSHVRQHAQVIVIGSGFGGAVAACRLAQAGFDVLVLERGRRYQAADFPQAGDFPPLPHPSRLLPDWRRWTWAGNQGLWDVLDLEELVSIQAAGWGGGSLIYANVHLRPPDDVFVEPWPEIYRGGTLLQEYFDLAAYMLEVAPIHVHAGFPKLIKAQRLREAAAALEREDGFFHPPLAIRHEPPPPHPAPRALTNVHGIEQGACTHCGACCTGCPSRAKNTLDFNYLALAERHGARALTQCEAIDIVQLDDGFRIECFNHITAQREALTCSYLFLCAGSVHTTRLLRRARLAQPDTGRCFAGTGYFPGGDALGVAYDTPEALNPQGGPAITTTLVQRDTSDPRQFSLIQDGGYAYEVARAVGMLRAPLWLGRNKHSEAQPARCTGARRTARPPAPRDEAVVGSAFDDVLDAISRGDFDRCVSATQREAFSKLLEQVTGPLLLPGVVDRTVEGMLRRFWKHLRLTRRLNPDRAPLSWLLGFERWCIRTFVGSCDAIAVDALRELVNPRVLSRHDVARDVLGYCDEQAAHRLMLLAMGTDAAPGRLEYDEINDRLIADLDLYRLAAGYSRDERLMTDIARHVGGELRTNPAREFLGKPITVHNQGGCGMGPPGASVTNQDGKVWGCERLYILDGSLLCSPVGVNPSATILALAERNVVEFIRTHGQARNWPEGDASAGAREYAEQLGAAREWIREKRAAGWAFAPPQVSPKAPKTPALGLQFHEKMEGHYSPTSTLPPRGPSGDAEYREHEARGRPHQTLKVELDVSIENLSVFLEDMRHQMSLTGTLNIVLPGHDKATQARNVVGTLQLPTPRAKPHGLPARDKRRAAQAHFARSYTTTVPSGTSRPGSRMMRYRLNFRDDAGRWWRLQGKKRIKDDPGIDAWRDTSSLLVKLFGPLAAELPLADPPRAAPLAGIGVIHVELNDFLFRQLPSIHVTGTSDPLRTAWATGTFARFFFGTLQRIYQPELTRFIDTLFRFDPGSTSAARREPAPGSKPECPPAGHEPGQCEPRQCEPRQCEPRQCERGQCEHGRREGARCEPEREGPRCEPGADTLGGQV